jgi:hypothetical protein
MERGLKVPFSPHGEVTFRRIALGLSDVNLLPARDVTYLIHLRLVDEKEGRLKLTALGRERYHGLPNDAAMSDVKNEAAAAVLRRRLLHACDR